MNTLIRLSPLFLQTLIWIPTQLVLKFFIHFKVEGRENIKNLKRPVIFASNHVSEIDPILIPASLPFFSRLMPMFYVSRKEYLDQSLGWRKKIYGGLFFKAWGAYPVYSGQNDYAISLSHHISLILDENSVCIFPEGGIPDDGKIGKIHGGVGFLAYHTRATVIPVTISGAWGMSFSDFFKRKRHITLTFGKPKRYGEEGGQNKDKQTDIPNHDFYLSIARDIMGV